MAKIQASTHLLKNQLIVQIREASPADAEGFVSYMELILSDGLGMVREKDERIMKVEEQRAWIQNFLDPPDSILIVAEHEGRIIANLDFLTPKLRRLKHNGMLGMAITPPWRSLGLGSLLMQCFLDWANSRQEIEKVSLNALSSNEQALALYRKFGFVEEGRQKADIKLGKDQYLDNVKMGLFLRPAGT